MIGDLVIETKGLRKTFISKDRGGKKEVEAVKGIDLTVRKGEIYGFLGRKRRWQIHHPENALNIAVSDWRRSQSSWI